MKKKILLSLTLICLGILVLGITVSAETYGDLTYEEFNDGEITITDCNTTVSGELVIPSTINGYPVTGIASCAFCDCQNLTSVVVPDGVTCIEDSAFYGCSSLKKISLPDSVTSIAYDAFEGTAYYEDEENWENGVLYINNHLYRTTGSISGKYIIKDGTVTICRIAFSDCENLTSVIIPDSVINIGKFVFAGCPKLKSISIPDSVVFIGSGFCSGCSNLKTVNLGKNITFLGPDSFRRCSSLTFILIPDNVELLEQCFSDCENLTTIYLPAGISITSYSFRGCHSISNILFSGTEEEWNEGEYCDIFWYADNIVFNATEADFRTGASLEDAIPIVLDKWYDEELGEYDINSAYITTIISNPNDIVYYKFTAIESGEYYISSENCSLYDKNINLITPTGKYGKYNLLSGKEYYIAVTSSEAGTIGFSIDLWNSSTLNAESVTAVNGENIIICSPDYTPEGVLIIVSYYKNDKLLETKYTTYKNKDEYFVEIKDFDCAKVMVWEDLISMKPVCEAVEL